MATKMRENPYLDWHWVDPVFYNLEKCHGCFCHCSWWYLYSRQWSLVKDYTMCTVCVWGSLSWRWRVLQITWWPWVPKPTTGAKELGATSKRQTNANSSKFTTSLLSTLLLVAKEQKLKLFLMPISARNFFLLQARKEEGVWRVLWIHCVQCYADRTDQDTRGVCRIQRKNLRRVRVQVWTP